MNHELNRLEELQEENNILKEMVADIVHVDDVKEDFKDVIEFLLEKSESKPLLDYTIQNSNKTMVAIRFHLNPIFDVETLIVLKEGCILVSSIHVEREFIKFKDSTDFIIFIDQLRNLKKQDLIELSYDELPFDGLEGVRITFSAKIPCLSKLMLSDLEDALNMVVLYNLSARSRILEGEALFWNESAFDFSE